MSGLVPQLDRLPDRDEDVVLAVVVEAAVVAGSLPPPRALAERIGRDQGDRPVVDPDGRVERGREAARDLDGLGGGRRRLPCRSATRSGLLVSAP